MSPSTIAEVPPQAVTVTSTVVQAVPAGAVAVIEIAEFTVKLVALTAPNLTAVTLKKPVPVIVTGVPPAGDPELGLKLVTVGAGVL